MAGQPTTGLGGASVSLTSFFLVPIIGGGLARGCRGAGRGGARRGDPVNKKKVCAVGLEDEALL